LSESDWEYVAHHQHTADHQVLTALDAEASPDM
jgi:hypothetical protein